MSDGLPAGQDFGAGISLGQPTPLSDVLADPEHFEEGTVLLRGRLADVCQRKGCWTVLEDGGARVRVRFVDYGFFLPRDAVGSQALVEGRVQTVTLSEAQARHYAAESRDGDPGAVRGPQREVGFLASGVRILERAASGAE